MIGQPNWGIDIANRMLSDVAHLEATIRLIESMVQLIGLWIVLSFVVVIFSKTFLRWRHGRNNRRHRFN